MFFQLSLNQFHRPLSFKKRLLCNAYFDFSWATNEMRTTTTTNDGAYMYTINLSNPIKTCPFPFRKRYIISTKTTC